MSSDNPVRKVAISTESQTPSTSVWHIRNGAEVHVSAPVNALLGHSQNLFEASSPLKWSYSQSYQQF